MRADAPTLAIADAINRILSGTERERDRALFQVSKDVVESLAQFYAPPNLAGLDVPAAFHGISLDSLRLRVHEQPAIGQQFGRYRDAILTHEETCARRLEVLRSTARTLLRLRTAAKYGVEVIDGLLAQLSGFVLDTWGRDLELSPADRGWSMRVSRRYDLLPISWREL